MDVKGALDYVRQYPDLRYDSMAYWFRDNRITFDSFEGGCLGFIRSGKSGTWVMKESKEIDKVVVEIRGGRF